MATTTEQAVRDILAANIAVITPSRQADVRFREHRYDNGDPLERWAEKNLECLRVFSILDRVDPFQPETTNTTEEWRQVTYDVLVAYPMTNRYGGGTAGARNRLEVMRSDLYQLETAVGLRGFATLTPAAYLVDRSEPLAAIDGDKVSFLRGALVYGLYRSTT